MSTLGAKINHFLKKIIHILISKLVITSDYASPGFATWRIGGFGYFFPIWRFRQLFGDFLAHFDPWTICDNSLQ